MDYSITARQFIADGFSVIRLQLDGTKSPVGQWKPYTQRMATDYELQTWFGSGECGIGVVGGAISRNLHIIDFDHDAEKMFEQFWADAQANCPGITDRLLVVQTPRPGRQVWFRQASTPPNSQTLAWTEPLPVSENSNQLQPKVAIETRGSNSYACAAGTHPATHPTGRPYLLIHGQFGSLPQLSDEESTALLDICRSYSKWQPRNVQRQPGETYQGEPRPGDVFNQQQDLRQLILDAGWELHHTDANGVDYLTRPNKTDPGWSASLGHIRSDDGMPLLYVFSDNAAPFDQNACYDAFAAYTYLHHGGDFSRSAAAVRIRYSQQVNDAQKRFHATVSEQLQDVEPYRPFPSDLLPDDVGAYVEAHADAIGLDAAFVGVPMLSTLAGLIGSSRELYLKRNWQLPSIIWTVTIGDVSSGKTPGWEAATAPAERIETAIHAAMSQADDDFERRLEDYNKAVANGDATATKPAKPDHKQQLMLDDATMESLVDIHAANPKLILSVDELAGWLRSMDQYRGGKGRDVQNWLSIYNGGRISVNRKKDGYRVWLPRTAISVCGTVQPGVAAETLFTDRFIENGFAARLLCVRPPSRIVRWSDAEVSEDVDNAVHELAERLYLLSPEQAGSSQRPIQIPCTGLARKTYITWTNDAADHAEKMMDLALRNAWLKLRPIAGRFALVLSICKQLTQFPHAKAMQPVCNESMQAGINLAWWFGNELERNYRCDDQTQLKSHLQWIFANHPAGLDARKLQQGRRNIRSAEDSRIILQRLVETGCGRLEGALFLPGRTS